MRKTQRVKKAAQNNIYLVNTQHNLMTILHNKLKSQSMTSFINKKIVRCHRVNQSTLGLVNLKMWFCFLIYRFKVGLTALSVETFGHFWEVQMLIIKQTLFFPILLKIDACRWDVQLV